MKAIVVTIALLGPPAVAAIPGTHVSEPVLLVLAGSALLGLASLLRRRVGER
jgi:hypothetical protein